MVVCAQCGRQSPDEFEFCPACGAPLSGPTAREVRKVVTVLFCDLTGSTSLGDRTDPETLRALMRRYYETARVILERHGGTVEKFVGDAVMAVFGIPVATEDDALRAVRAAVDLRDTVHDLGLEARIGVNTGDVVAGEGDTFVTGDAVNVAARLEQSAGAGDVLLGVGTMSLVRDAVTTEPVGLSLKGKPGTVTAYRLLALDRAASGLARHLDRPLVGRQRERERLRADFTDAAASRTCRLFTLIGPAGVGKSRLVADFLAQIGETATVAHGRALSYGDGITYWPLVEMLVQLGIEPDDAISSSSADTQLATRAVFERAAEDRPLILVLDDLQWAEEPLLDLIEHIADWSREAPILLLCIARPELLDVRPGWGGGKFNATSILLEPLGEAEAGALADALLADLDLDAATRSHILAIAEGNPLFLEEMAALAREAEGAVQVPPTIRALLQARLDTLNEDERTVIERGAVEGKVFHRAAVTALSPAASRDGVSNQLVALVRKELVRPDRSQITGDDAYRFRHLLIRDTAYDSLPKGVRAELHERFADWVDSQAGLEEEDEIVGYHLEHAARYLRELDEHDARGRELAARAGTRLATAGIAANDRGDLHAVRNLLGRAVALLPHGNQRRRVLPDLVEALFQGGQRTQLERLLGELEQGNPLDRATAVVLRVLIEPAGVKSTIAETRAALVAAGQQLPPDDHVALARYERARGALEWLAVDAVESHAAYLRAYDHIRSADRPNLVRDLVDPLSGTALFSGATAAEGIRLLAGVEEWLGEKAGPLLTASLHSSRSLIAYLAGDILVGELQAICDHYIELLRQTGLDLDALGAKCSLAFIEWVEGNLSAEERITGEVVAEYERLEDRNYLINMLGNWALGKSRLGDPETALNLVARGRLIGSDVDIADQINLDLAEGHARAVLGDHEAAASLLQSARSLAAGMRMRPLLDAIAVVEAEVARMAGDTARAAEIVTPVADVAESLGLRRYAAALRRDALSG